KYDMQNRDDAECQHMPQILGYASRKFDIEPTKNSGNDISHYSLPNPPQCERRYRNTQLGCRQVAIEVGSDMLGHLGHLAAGLDLNLDLGGPNFNNCKLSGYEKAVRKDEKKSPKNFPAH